MSSCIQHNGAWSGASGVAWAVVHKEIKILYLHVTEEACASPRPSQSWSRAIEWVVIAKIELEKKYRNLGVHTSPCVFLFTVRFPINRLSKLGCIKRYMKKKNLCTLPWSVTSVGFLPLTIDCFSFKADCVGNYFTAIVCAITVKLQSQANKKACAPKHGKLLSIR